MFSFSKIFPVHNFNKSGNIIPIKLKCANVRLYSRNNKLGEYARCYKVLNLPNESDQETVRRAFIDLCKKYHPDSQNETADALKFQEVETAYRTLQNKFAEERWNVNDCIGEYGLYYKEKKKENEKVQAEIFDIRHTAPQHRQYLSYDGVGSGTPSQRQKQYTKYKTAVAVENVTNHNIKKLTQTAEGSENCLIIKDNIEAKKIKTRYGMERLVEDLIQESMAKGQFDNLKGRGKPLPPSNYNPYVDFVTHKMNQVMIENGFVPEWIHLQKEIADETDSIRNNLKTERKKLGAFPLTFPEDVKWENAVNNLRAEVQKLNSKINKFNLVVPVMNKQKIYFNLEKESLNILKNESHAERKLNEKKRIDDQIDNSSSDFFSFFRF